MELKDIQKVQKDFDKEFFKKLWEINDEKVLIQRLQYLTVALAGEVGEYANIVKKISRDFENLKDPISNERKQALIEEMTDCFIYIIIIANLLEVDLEKEYMKKLEKNKQRFEKYKDG